jgi:hypothetical protein
MAYYPGLGAPISQFGYNPDGTPSAGPYSFLPGAQQASQQAAQQQYGGANYHGWRPPTVPANFTPSTTPGTPGTPAATSTTTMTSGPTAGAESWLNGVLAGTNLPFSPEVQSAQLATASDMTSDAEAARNGAMNAQAAAGGASANDPSLQGAKMNSMARRQSDNTQAQNSIKSQANIKNFGAQMDAAGQLQQTALTREGFAHNMQNQALGFLPWNAGGRGNSGGGEGGDDGGGHKQGGNGFMGFYNGPGATTNSYQTPYGAMTPQKKPQQKPQQSWNTPDDYDEVMGG